MFWSKLNSLPHHFLCVLYSRQSSYLSDFTFFYPVTETRKKTEKETAALLSWEAHLFGYHLCQYHHTRTQHCRGLSRAIPGARKYQAIQQRKRQKIGSFRPTSDKKSQKQTHYNATLCVSHMIHNNPQPVIHDVPFFVHCGERHNHHPSRNEFVHTQGIYHISTDQIFGRCHAESVTVTVLTTSNRLVSTYKNHAPSSSKTRMHS